MKRAQYKGSNHEISGVVSVVWMLKTSAGVLDLTLLQRSW